jgi:hypothetical protein
MTGDIDALFSVKEKQKRRNEDIGGRKRFISIGRKIFPTCKLLGGGFYA